MSESELLGRLVHTAHELSVTLLELERFAPFGLELSADCQKMVSTSPADDHPDADFDDLIDMLIDHLRDATADGRAAGVALVLPMDSSDPTGHPAIGLQVETASTAFFWVTPYMRSAATWTLGESDEAAELFCPDGLFCVPPVGTG